MKLFFNILFALCALLGQVIPFEGTDWGITYLNAHPSGLKLLPLLIGIVSSFLFTCTISPIKNATYGILVDSVQPGQKAWNPFWVWLIICLIINFGINLFLE